MIVWFFPLGGGGDGSASTTTSGSTVTVTPGPPTIPSDLSCGWQVVSVPTVGWSRLYPETAVCGAGVGLQEMRVLAWDSFKGPVNTPLSGSVFGSQNFSWTTVNLSSTTTFGQLVKSGSGAVVWSGLAQEVVVLPTNSFGAIDNFEVWMDAAYEVADNTMIGPHLMFWSANTEAPGDIWPAVTWGPTSSTTWELFGASSVSQSSTYEVSVNTLNSLMRLGATVSDGTVTPWIEPFGGGERSEYTTASARFQDFFGSASMASQGYAGFQFFSGTGEAGVTFFQLDAEVGCD